MKLAYVIAPVLLLAACGPQADSPREVPRVAMSEAARTEMARVNGARFAMQMPAQLPQDPRLSGATIETPTPAAGPPAGETATEAAVPPEARFDAGMVRIQVLLDRAHISPGVIDGYDGENVRKAVEAYQTSVGIPATGIADDALLTRLEQADTAPALVAYVIQDADVAGPFADVPSGLEAQSRLERLGYESAEEAIAERFHMDVDLLRTLNPDTDFGQAGTEIVVANAGGDLNAEVASIEIDKSDGALRAFDATGRLVAFYPASIGSADAPAPTGDYEVRAVAFDPVYTYDPARLPTFGERGHGRVSIQPGPNNPVGAVWIALSLDTYGIHGTPDPQQVSKTQSHGCVRLTNWDAVELGRAVREGVSVRFVESAAAQRQTGRG